MMWWWAFISVLLSLVFIAACIMVTLVEQKTPLKKAIHKSLWAAEWQRFLGTPLMASLVVSLYVCTACRVIAWDPWLNFLAVYGICFGVCCPIFLLVDTLWMYRYRQHHRDIILGMAQQSPGLLT